MFHELPISEEEKNNLLQSIPWITILIAGADGKLETKELEWAEKITRIRSYSHPHNLDQFYEELGKDYQQRVDALVEKLSEDPKQRTAILSQKLSSINPILAKLDNPIAFSYYNSLVSFAHHVAKASGGFLRFFSVSTEEKHLMNLPMIDKIELEEQED